MTPSDRRIPWRSLILWLLLPALCLRIAVVLFAAQDPIVAYPFGGGLSYAKWALEITRGDWVGAGRPVFYQAPLYPYVLAGLQALGSGFYPWPQLVNVVAGVVAVLFVFLTALHLFGRRAAWIAGGAGALWGPAIMYESLIDKVSLAFALTAAVGYVFVRLFDAARTEPKLATKAVLAGVLLGLGAMLRENLLLLAPVAVIWIGVARSARTAVALALGVLLGIIPALAHNVAFGGEWMPTTYQGGTNYWIGNRPGADGTYHPLIEGHGDPIHEEKDARTLAASVLGMATDDIRAHQVQSYWFGRAFAFAARDPFAWLVLQFRKLQWFLYHAEAPDSVAYDAFRVGRPWLLPSRLMFGLLLPLAVLGFVFARRNAAARFLAALAGVLAASVIAFYVVGRYRLATVPFLIPLAAYGVLGLRDRLRPVVFAAAAALLLPSQMWLLGRHPAPLDATNQEALLWLNRGVALGNWRSDKGPAIDAFSKAVELEPRLVSAHKSLVRLLLDPSQRDYARALRHCEAAVRLVPADLEARHNLGYCLMKLNRLERAEKQFRLVLESAGAETSPLTVQQLAIVLDNRGKHTEANKLRSRFGVEPPK